MGWYLFGPPLRRKKKNEKMKRYFHTLQVSIKRPPGSGGHQKESGAEVRRRHAGSQPGVSYEKESLQPTIPINILSQIFLSFFIIFRSVLKMFDARLVNPVYVRE